MSPANADNPPSPNDTGLSAGLSAGFAAVGAPKPPGPPVLKADGPVLKRDVEGFASVVVVAPEAVFPLVLAAANGEVVGADAPPNGSDGAATFGFAPVDAPKRLVEAG